LKLIIKILSLKLKRLKFFVCIYFILIVNICFSQISKDSSFVFYFNTSSAKITSETKIQFQNFCSKFKNRTEFTIEIYGFADKNGKEENNLILSQTRIDSVLKLIPNFDKNQIQTFANGEKFSQNTDKNKDFRKVVLIIKKKKIEYSEINATIDTNSIIYKRFNEFSKINTSVVLNIFFELNKTKITPNSEKDLKILLQYLLKIQI
jgi:outer membrane protein OmpA-like peptidoglycan-associated protein